MGHKKKPNFSYWETNKGIKLGFKNRIPKNNEENNNKITLIKIKIILLIKY